MKKKIVGSLLLLSWSLAFSISPIKHLDSELISTLKEGYFVLQAGGYWSSQGKQQHIDINNLIGDEFTVTHSQSSNGLVGLGYFIEKAQSLSYGINAFYLLNTPVKGTVVQENLFTNLAYNYYISHYPVYADVKTKLPLSNQALSLLVDAGIGPNFMRTGGFSETPLDGITLPDNAFSGHTSTTFSATAGVGLQFKKIFGETPLDCGYRFFYLGQGRLSKNNTQIINNLFTGPVYANAIVCGLKI